MASEQGIVDGRLRATADAHYLLLRFELRLRERIVAVLSTNPLWWRRLVPGDVKLLADDRRTRDRQSPFAPQLAYHQIYYCYPDDLLKILLYQRNYSAFGIEETEDLIPRMSELVALRNRVAHGRLLSDAELTRVQRLVGELQTLLDLNVDPKELSLEDPLALLAKASEYLAQSETEMLGATVPSPPAPIEALLRSGAALDSIDDKGIACLLAVRDWLGGKVTLRGKPGSRLAIRSAFDKLKETGQWQKARALVEELLRP